MMLLENLNLPKMPSDTPVNMIFTGVAGTGKTHLMQQVAKQNYTIINKPIDKENLLNLLIEPLKWQEVIRLIFLEQKHQNKELLKISEMIEHPFFIAKSQQKAENNSLYSTAQNALLYYSNPNSKTLAKKIARASVAYFDKDESSNWYLMDESLPLLADLSQKLSDYQNAIANQQAIIQQNYIFVSFHQTYGYEEFIEGIRPILNTNGQMSYRIEQGVFLKLCELANKNPNQRFAIFIDEINRANVAKVFGELMSLIEPSKRAGQASTMTVALAYSGETFSVPSNVDIFATMNSQDHSLAPLDLAFRRRFSFVECLPMPTLLGKITVDNVTLDLAILLEKLNDKIADILGKDSQLGHSFLWEIHGLDKLANAFLYNIVPQVAQSCQNDGQILQQIFGESLITVEEKQVHQHFLRQNYFVVNKGVLFGLDYYVEFYKNCVY